MYTLEWKDIDLQGSLVSGASSGGAIGMIAQGVLLMIAITGDDRKIRLYSGVKAAQSGIRIYSASGQLIHNIKVQSSNWSIQLTTVGQGQNTGTGMVRRRAIDSGERRRYSSML